jgi:glutathione peroxidase-family protein
MTPTLINENGEVVSFHSPKENPNKLIDKIKEMLDS